MIIRVVSDWNGGSEGVEGVVDFLRKMDVDMIDFQDGYFVETGYARNPFRFDDTNGVEFFDVL